MKIFQKAITACFCILVISGGLTAQVTDFKLKDYKYRTPVYQSLQLDLDLEESGSTGKENKGMTADLEAFIAHLRVFATDQRQHISTKSGYFNPGFGSSKQGDVKSNNNTLNGGLRYSVQDRRYKPNFFIETGGAAGANSFNRKNGIKGQALTNGDSHAYLELVAGVGKGRLEYVHDAQAALLILEDLYAAGIIKSKVDNETANRFAQLITNIKKQRILDSRRRTIFKLTQVDSFLRVNKLTTQCDARTMAIINDILFYSFQNDLSGNMNEFGDDTEFSWNRGEYDEGFESTDYAFVPQVEIITDQAFRQHGTIMYARFIPELRYNGFRTKQEKPTGDSVTKSTYVHVAPGIQLGYEKHDAIDLKWQKNYRASLSFIYTKYLESKPNPNPNYHLTQLDLSYELGYYPNSRSVIEGTGSFRFSHYGGTGQNTNFITPGVGLNAGYFVSYNTVLRASFSANYQIQTGSTNESRLAQGLRIFLRHYFF